MDRAARLVPSIRPLEAGPDQGPWRTIEDVELATLGWVHWFNTERIHSYLDDTSPDYFEAAYAAQQADQPMVGIQ